MLIQPLRQKDLGSAVELFCAGYRGLHKATCGLMPARWGDPAEVAPLVQSLHCRYPMVGAFEAGRLTGYLGGMLLPEFKGKDPGVYCPEWGHAVAAGLPAAQRRWVYRKMYETIGENWVGDGRLNQAITILAHDAVALDAWFWSTFGLLVVDVVRDLSPVERRAGSGGATGAGGAAGAGESSPGFAVRAAVAGVDLPKLYPLLAEHESYYNRSPIWLPKAPLDEHEAAEWAADPKSVVWIAEEHGTGDILGMARHTIDSDDAATVVRDEGTVACTGAYVLPRARARGVGTALLGAMVDWGRRNGYQRLSLDFEAANIYGSRFWLSHLTPACFSVIRHVNDRIMKGGGIGGGVGGGVAGGGIGGGAR